jgi:hypothetical protein
MAVTVKDLIRRARTVPRVVKLIAAVLAADLVVLLIASSLLDDEVAARAGRIEDLRGQLAAVRQKIATTREQINRLPELRRSYDAAVADGVLASQDRLKLVSQSQTLGTQNHLSDLHYKLEAEVAAKVPDTKYALVTTPVTFAGGGLLDTDVLAFWAEALDNLQSRYEVVSASIDREPLAMKDLLAGIKTGRPIAAVKSELVFHWISLRDEQQAKK